MPECVLYGLYVEIVLGYICYIIKINSTLLSRCLFNVATRKRELAYVACIMGFYWTVLP